ncbi:DUF4263 domain-containing protein [Candidatus Bathyarchaeota archaeon]|nr:DUF4263 domain-containing protein [Candidatus Bathyarchaeota archaeon]
MDDLAKFIALYLDEIENCIGQIPSKYWAIFPDFFHHPYIIRAGKCSNGVAISFKRPAPRYSINVESSRKRAEEIFLPYLPPPCFAVFAWTNARRVWHLGNSIANFDWSREPAKGTKFQGPGEDFRRMSVMHLKGSNEVQMMYCSISGVDDRGRVKRIIRFLWMMTEDCVELTEEKAKWYGRQDFSRYLNHILFAWNPVKLSETAKIFLTKMLESLKTRFCELISRTDVDEQELQDFFEDHKLAIDLDARQVWSKQNLGKGNQADFILDYGDSIRLVEIKRPFDRIFDGKMKLSATTCKALSELSRYQKWVVSKKSVAKERYGSGILRKSWCILGRADHMSQEELKRLAAWNLKSSGIEIRTFDYLLKNFDSRIDQLKS